MVVENLIKKKGKYEFEPFLYGNNITYRYYSGSSRVFHSEYEYWYDGRLLLIGAFYLEELAMIDAETGATAVTRQDFQRKPTVKMLIEKFKEKLERSGKTVHEVVRNFKSNNLDLELWLINSLII